MFETETVGPFLVLEVEVGGEGGLAALVATPLLSLIFYQL